MRYAMLLTVLCSLVGLVAPQQAAAYALKTTSEGQPVRWQQPNVALQLDASVTDVLGQEAVLAAATMAAEAWRGLAGAPDVTIERGAPAAYDATRRNNGVYLLAEWPFEDDQIAMTITTSTSSGVIVGVDILLNGERTFEMLSETEGREVVHTHEGAAHDLAAVLTHEIGHALGLAHTETDEGATMWPRIRTGETHQRTLSEDDERAIEEAYAAPFQTPVTTTTACTAAPIGTSLSGGAAPLCFGLLGLALVARSRRRV